jgi:glycosyltransferase involved in cell wall biosynthesis
MIPYFTRNNIKISDSVVIGGIERFAQLIYQNFDDVVPVHFTDEDRKKRRVTNLISAAVDHHQPDVIIVNYDNDPVTVNLQAAVNVPILWISHTGAGGISKLGHVKSMQQFLSKNGTLAMVSEHQWQGMDKLSRRVENKPLELNGGLINSAFSLGNEVVSEADYNAVTVGRTDKTKNPFWMHKKLQKSGLHNVVLTSYVSELLYGEHKTYYEENLHWEAPNEVIRGLSYTDTMKKLSQASCYISTCPVETWGITALEALAHGLPTILVTNSTESHASECIPAINRDVVKVKTTISSSDLEAIVRKLDKTSFQERLEISDRTKEKHSRQAWKTSIENAIDKTINNHKATSNSFMTFFT